MLDTATSRENLSRMNIQTASTHGQQADSNPAAAAGSALPTLLRQEPPSASGLSAEAILELARRCGIVTGPNLRKSDGCYYYRSHGTQTNVRDRDLVTLVYAAIAANAGAAIPPAAEDNQRSPQVAVEPLAREFAARIFSGRKGHGGAPVSYMQITQEELTHIIVGAVGLCSPARPQQVHAVAAEERLASAIHYPGCWDTTAYPTVHSALAEISTTFACSSEECPHHVANPPQR